MVTHNLLKLSSSFADILDKQKRGINNANISNLWVGKKMKDDNFLKANNAKHLWHPMGHPKESLEKPPKIIRKAEGVKITDIDGHQTVDAVGGLWCVNLGYSNDTIKEAITRQLYDLPYYSSFAGTTNAMAIEASYMVRNLFAADGMSRVFFTSGGSDSRHVSAARSSISPIKR